MLERIASVGQISRLSGSRAGGVLRPHLPIASIRSSTAPATRSRGFHSIPGLQASRKQEERYNQQDFDREVLNPERAEGTVSGTDSEVAKYETAYDPSNTSPESEMKDTETESHQRGKPGGPLNVSGANKDVNIGRDENHSGPSQNVERGVHSSRGVTEKRGKGPRSS